MKPSQGGEKRRWGGPFIDFSLVKFPDKIAPQVETAESHKTEKQFNQTVLPCAGLLSVMERALFFCLPCLFFSTMNIPLGLRTSNDDDDNDDDDNSRVERHGKRRAKFQEDTQNERKFLKMDYNETKWSKNGSIRARFAVT